MMIASCIVVEGTDTTLLFRKRSAVLTENDQNSHLPTFQKINCKGQDMRGGEGEIF